MTLCIELMTEAARRYGSGPGMSAGIADASNQGRHGMEAPDTGMDGVLWYADDFEDGVSGLVPRIVELR